MLRAKRVQLELSKVSDARYLRYLGLLEALVPQNTDELFRRFLFSYCSVQLSWQNNVGVYNRLADLSWVGQPDQLERIKEAFREQKCGFHNTRPKFISAFADSFYKVNGPEWHWKSEDESWSGYRSRLDKSMSGISTAKISFVLEMVYPDETEAVCFDRHFLNKVFDVKKTKYGFNCTKEKYERFEDTWNKVCRDLQVSPGIARLALWDKYQGYADPTFWSYVFD